MTTAAITRRLAALEKQSAKAMPQFGFTCIPLWTDPHFTLEEIAPGIWKDKNAWGHGKRSVMYATREQLDAWLALPEQASRRHCVYHVLSVEECDKIRADLEASC